MQSQKWLLRKFARSKDPRIHPKQQLLASLLLGVLEEIYPFELIKWLYGNNPDRIKWGTEELTPEEQEKLAAENKDYLEQVYKKMIGGDNANSDSTSESG